MDLAAWIRKKNFKKASKTYNKGKVAYIQHSKPHPRWEPLYDVGVMKCCVIINKWHHLKFESVSPGFHKTLITAGTRYVNNISHVTVSLT